MNFQKKMRGVRLAHRKSTERQSALRMPPPSLVTLPMSMHIGAPAKPIVKVGDPVFVGQKIAEASGFVSAAVFASVSGKVKKLDTMTDSLGRTIETVVIESDGLMTPLEGLSPREVNTPSELSDAARDAGLVGLGGAGFPTAVKLAAQPERVSHVVINGAECEPYITSDTRTMVEGADLLAEGAELLSRIYGADVIFGVEKNKPEAISALQKALSGNPRASVKVLPSIYPQGGEKVLVYNCIGRIIGEGKLPLDVGAIVVNCTTLYKLMEFIKTGMPLVEKTVTVDGSAIREPKNLTCPIGTPIGELIEFCGGFSREPRKILYGGPMMGVTVPDLSYPILKNTNAIVALAKDAILPEPSECIRCGKCADACPLSLTPFAIASAVKHKDAEALSELSVGLCMECGCCSYTCPAHRPLVSSNRLGKSILKNTAKGGK